MSTVHSKTEERGRGHTFRVLSRWPSFKSGTAWECSLQKVSLPFLAKREE